MRTKITDVPYDSIKEFNELVLKLGGTIFSTQLKQIGFENNSPYTCEYYLPKKSERFLKKVLTNPEKYDII